MPPPSARFAAAAKGTWMLAPQDLPAQFAAWNRAHRAPFGPRWWRVLGCPRGIWRRRMQLPVGAMRRIGPFGFQKNSPARAFEYPWAWFATPLEPGMRVVELGAGASGLQFVLADQGLDVTMVDPLIEPEGARGGWRFAAPDFARLNAAFGGRVTAVFDHLENAPLPDESVDRVFCISVLEHVPEEALNPLAAEIGRILRPGGCLVATVDLFLDCRPFGPTATLPIGANISVKRMLEAAGLALRLGRPEELNGFPHFSPTAVLEHLDRFLLVTGVLTQCVVGQKGGAL